jgi:hypothetical protein
LRDLEILKEEENRAVTGGSIRTERLVKEQEVDRRLDVAKLELETLANFIDCEGSKLTKIKARLADENDRTTRTLTTTSILAAAISSISVAGILVSGDEDLKQGDAKDWIGVAGGLVAAYLAVMSAKVNKKATLRHDVNAIKAIWTGDNSAQVFPSSSWYLLNEKRLLHPTDFSVREGIIETWNDEPSLLGGKDNVSQVPTLLDTVGDYDEEMLQLRIDMMEEIENGIDKVSSALYLINVEMNR